MFLTNKNKKQKIRAFYLKSFVSFGLELNDRSVFFLNYALTYKLFLSLSRYKAKK